MRDRTRIKSAIPRAILVGVAALACTCSLFTDSEGLAEGGAPTDAASEANPLDGPTEIPDGGDLGDGGDGSEPPKTPAVIAMGQEQPREIEADGTNIYWINSGTGKVMAMRRPDLPPVADGATSPVVLASTATSLLVLSGAKLVFAGDAVFKSVSKTGGATNNVVVGAALSPNAIAADGALLVWTNLSDNTVRRCSATGSCVWYEQAPLAASASPQGIAMDALFVYWCDPTAGEVRRVARAGGTAESLISDAGKPNQLALGSEIFFLDAVSGVVAKAPKQGGPVVTLATGRAQPLRIVTDDQSVFWIEAVSGAILKCPQTGCGDGPIELARAEGTVADLAVDDTFVYWSETSAGAIRAIAK